MYELNNMVIVQVNTVRDYHMGGGERVGLVAHRGCPGAGRAGAAYATTHVNLA